MREMGLQGVIRGKPIRTTVSGKAAPFGIDAGIWEQLGAAETIYLKLLEQEPNFMPQTSIREPESEPDDLFGFESDSQALRREWLDNRDRDLEQTGCTALLQRPDRIRLRTASEVAACPAALDLFRGVCLSTSSVPLPNRSPTPPSW